MPFSVGSPTRFPTPAAAAQDADSPRSADDGRSRGHLNRRRPRRRDQPSEPRMLLLRRAGGDRLTGSVVDSSMAAALASTAARHFRAAAAVSQHQDGRTDQEPDRASGVRAQV